MDRADLPPQKKEGGPTTFRSITIDGKELEFSEGFTDLHTVLYKETLAGRGFGIDDARQSIQLVYNIRNSVPVGVNSNSHELAQKAK